MKHVLKTALVAGALGLAALLTPAPASAHERDRSSVSVYVDFGNISVAYRNGYFDRRHRWHSWRSRDHRHAYCGHRGRCHNYNYRHDRGRHRGHRRGRGHDRH